MSASQIEQQGKKHDDEETHHIRSTITKDTHASTQNRLEHAISKGHNAIHDDSRARKEKRTTIIQYYRAECGSRH
jgi:predicted kinase